MYNVFSSQNIDLGHFLKKVGSVGHFWETVSSAGYNVSIVLKTVIMDISPRCSLLSVPDAGCYQNTDHGYFWEKVGSVYNVSNPEGLDHGYLCKKAGSL